MKYGVDYYVHKGFTTFFLGLAVVFFFLFLWPFFLVGFFTEMLIGEKEYGSKQ